MRKTIFLLLAGMLLISACTKSEELPGSDLVGQGSSVGSTDTQSSGQQDTAGQTVQKPDTNNAQTGGNEIQSTQTQATPDVKEFRITARSWEFEPAIIEVNKGDKVRLIVTSVDVPHGISIPEYGINERLEVGKPVTIEFTAEKEGSFNAFCSVFCGSGHSKMKGQIVVK